MIKPLVFIKAKTNFMFGTRVVYTNVQGVQVESDMRFCMENTVTSKSFLEQITEEFELRFPLHEE